MIGREDGQARALLEASGVRIHRLPAGATDAPAALVEAVLPEGERDVRAEVAVLVPADPDEGMGTWHVNAVDELHVVASGEGVMEFITLDGPVAVVIEAGDVVEVRGAEHRYRPLTEQRWVLRFGGPAGADLVPTHTGRASGEWPAP